MKLGDEIRSVKGVGEKTEKCFHKMNIFTVGDLLEHYPRGYDIFGPIQPIDSVQEGQIASIEGFIKDRPALKKSGSLKILSVRFADESGGILITWYNMPFLQNRLRMGTKYIFRGKIERKRYGYEMIQPKIYTDNEFFSKAGKLFPVYPLTNGLTNHFLAKTIKYILGNMENICEHCPLEIRKRRKLILISKALKNIHFPESGKQYAEARKRIVFDEFFSYSLALAMLKEQKSTESVYPFKPVPELAEFKEKLPFPLTAAQQKVQEELESDLYGGNVMNRLIQGDVGSGKTIIAVMALLLAVKNKTQGAFMVPTEVLAVQQFHSLRDYLEPYGIRIGLLTGSLTAKEKRESHQKITGGVWDIVVGTHAIIQEKVDFENLALVITDEQHRFGVKQREHLYKKGREPHVLAMSATPIPRTLALMLYGDMDLSVIDMLPAGRLPVKTCAVGSGYRPTAYHFIEEEIKKGHQAYIICPMVEESETMELENVTVYAEECKSKFRSHIRIKSLHGKMGPNEKNQIMNDFAAGIIDVLVSTTVIEVGIDIKNATVIMIENAERFGLAQLHQLRGRVGRGEEQSYCVLMTGTKDKEAISRLNVLVKSNDGFHIASEDLKLRGQGDLFGIQQSGEKLFKSADIFEDAAILKSVSEEVKGLTGKQIKNLYQKNAGHFNHGHNKFHYITI